MGNNLTLLELQQKIKQTLAGTLEEKYWITAEINDLKVNSSGHCYLELVQKDTSSKFIQARITATIWSYSFGMLNSFFKSSLNRDLQAGMKILVKVNIQYHEIYGISLNITDIDPSYTMGDIELERRKIIAHLKQEGLFTRNKELEFPELPLRLAVISSENAAGYQDFIKHISHNQFGFGFNTKLFPAILQGTSAVSSIIAAIQEISKHSNNYDLIVLIRGGGSQSDLFCFDNYELAKAVALSPIPVLTGIGHDKDISITDMIASKSLKTPTAVADYLVDTLKIQAEKIDNYTNSILVDALNLISEENAKLQQASNSICSTTRLAISKDIYKLNEWFPLHLTLAGKQFLKNEAHKLDLFTAGIKANDPKNILKKGYSITYFQGKAVRSADQLKEGDQIETFFEKNTIPSIIIKNKE